ncbi:hypothetical protein ALI144C_19605 [Actinosynnema sp. ALI-1.44]|uniref:Pvc16 family protein n=1 Tax=Actinosynnema sp. ALI-1.44 TaxID=1933779 RepID=UPI00097C7882|nr:Pvc16 family protein [Actinosynnema sp. ALI-1.44]ONI81522.1 hypothetical protein ALI144C_19605 [Actinosynnema sp. ALI-1.44]
MLSWVDTALEAVLAAGLGAGVAVSFDVPGSWSRGRAVELFLHRVREDLRGRTGGWEDIRDSTGRVTGRRVAPRRYELSYLVTAWADSPSRGHDLLGDVLATLGPLDAIPSKFLPEQAEAVPIEVANPGCPAVPPDFWLACGVPPRPALDVVVTVSVGPATPEPVAAAPGVFDLGVARPPRAQPPAAAVPKPKSRIREEPDR